MLGCTLINYAIHTSIFQPQRLALITPGDTGLECLLELLANFGSEVITLSSRDRMPEHTGASEFIGSSGAPIGAPLEPRQSQIFSQLKLANYPRIPNLVPVPRYRRKA